MIITIGGSAGSGTTTAAKVLSEKLDIPYLSTGSIFRQMAKEHGMSVIEFNKFSENNADIDKELDKRQAEIAYESGNIVVEGRLSAYFIEADLKIWMYVLKEFQKENQNLLMLHVMKLKYEKKVKLQDTWKFIILILIIMKFMI